MQDFGTSWLVTESPSGVNIDTNTCISINQSKCVLSPTDQATCRKLLDTMDFDICHNIVDPMPYLMACQDSMCSGGSYCDSFEAYSRKCQQMGVCLIWRSSEMCPHFCPPRKFLFFIYIKFHHLKYYLVFRLGISTLWFYL